MIPAALKDLPKKPIDQCTFEWWELWKGSTKFHINHIVVVYHVNTPWAKACPGDTGRAGCDFVDDWQIVKDGRFSARWDGWDSPNEIDWRFSRTFETLKEAQQGAIKEMRSLAAHRLQESNEWALSAAALEYEISIT